VHDAEAAVPSPLRVAAVGVQNISPALLASDTQPETRSLRITHINHQLQHQCEYARRLRGELIDHQRTKKSTLCSEGRATAPAQRTAATRDVADFIEMDACIFSGWAGNVVVWGAEIWLTKKTGFVKCWRRASRTAGACTQNQLLIRYEKDLCRYEWPSTHEWARVFG
jgi:hypothetical protein